MGQGHKSYRGREERHWAASALGHGWKEDVRGWEPQFSDLTLVPKPLAPGSPPNISPILAASFSVT